MKPWHHCKSLFGFLLATCFTPDVLLQPGLAQPLTNSLQANYRAAIQDAALVEPEKDVDTLISITPDNPLLVFCQEFFDGLKTLKKHTPQASQICCTRQLLVDRLLVWNSTRTQVLVVTWKSQRVYEQFIKLNTQSSKREDQLLWVTAAPQVKAFCQRYLQQHPYATAADLMLRLKQTLATRRHFITLLGLAFWLNSMSFFGASAYFMT